MKRWRAHSRCRRGFTLIELVVVMTIITILAAAVTVTVTNRIRHARRSKAILEIEAMETALDLYEADNGYPPATEQGLQALIAEPSMSPVPRNWNGPYLKNRKTAPKDPWGNEYVYQYPGQSNPDGYDLICYGSDGQPGGDDEFSADITNLDEE
ncbi:MAG: type II secretion system major pseudopilin GspG [Armatimonadota bacterium]|nr:type II secretion system major pseudopilin GspG [Armatimonadota bacterium]